MKSAFTCAALTVVCGLSFPSTRAADAPAIASANTSAAAPAAAPAMPSEWIDQSTGHLIVRLSKEPGTTSMYFHQNGYTPDGKKLLIFTPEGMSTVDLATHAIDLLVPGYRVISMSLSNGIEVSRKEPVVYYSQYLNRQNAVIAMNMETHVWKQVAVLPSGAVIGGISADDKTIMGIRNVDGGKQIYTIDLQTGATKSFFPSDDGLSHDNLNHFECSPTDPDLMLFAHEGDWTQVDRIWTMHPDGTGLKLMYTRPEPDDRYIAGHEFFSRDGQWVYYDLQTPESGVFWIGGTNIKTGEQVRYPIQRSEWSVHYYVSWDGKVFSGDGGGPNSVANRDPNTNTQFDPPQNGQWMYLFTPTGEYTTTTINGVTVKTGKLTTEKLANLQYHNYGNGEASRVEPNATFTPDDKWLVFRSNMEGTLNVYEVEIAKATPEEIKRCTDEWTAYDAAKAAFDAATAAKPAETK
jgi:oligogalacturonide lyase